MTEEEQKKIFASNLSRYVANSGKPQKDVAKALDVNEKTFNGWCNGISMPKMWTIQKLADYFQIPKSHLLDEWNNSDEDAYMQLGRLLAHELQLKNAIHKCVELSDDDKKLVIDFINRLYDGRVKD